MSDQFKQILVIEDDPDLPELLKKHLETLDYRVEVATTGSAGLELAKEKHFDLIVVDYNLPEFTGVQVIKSIRAEGQTTPVLMLTSRTDEIDKVTALNAGADDYVTKPFGLAELVARINALLRRSGMPSEAQEQGVGKLAFGNLEIDLSMRVVTKDGQLVDLTPLEFSLLEFLVQAEGRPLDRGVILEEVWGTEVREYEYSLTSVVARLRKKIEDTASNPKLIITVRGYGYRFARQDELS